MAIRLSYRKDSDAQEGEKPRCNRAQKSNQAILRSYEALQSYRDQGVKHEGVLETAFQRLLADTAKVHHCTLIPKQKIRINKNNLFPDGTVRDIFSRRGFWEAKDTDDDLDKEIAAKGYPLSNTIFEDTRQTLNPNISRAAVDEMLMQHLLTERLIRKIFDNPEFMHRNVIAAEIEKVIDALVSLSFNRDQFLKSLDRFYRAIEDAAHTLEDFAEKQHFLNTVYELSSRATRSRLPTRTASSTRRKRSSISCAPASKKSSKRSST